MKLPQATLPLGIVIRRIPSPSRWARWSWKAVAVLPGARVANWRELRRDGEAVEFHAGTVTLELWRADTEAYLQALAARVPSVGVVMRETGDPAAPFEIVCATASPYELQDYADTGEEVIELVPMPAGLVAFIRAFCDEHHREEPFIKRKRDRKRIDLVEDGIGDPRIRQATDVYRAPRRKGYVQ